MQIVGRLEVALLQGTAVASDDRFVASLLGIGGAGEQIVAGEGHAQAVDFTMQARVEFGLARHPVASQRITLPVDGFAVPQNAVELQG